MKGFRSPRGLLAALLLLAPALGRADKGPDDPGTDEPGLKQPPAAAKPTPPTTSPAPPATPAAAPAAPANTGASYTVRLHDLERRVNELKERIFRSKARLNLLKETVLHGVIAGSRAVIMHRNEMGNTYTLIRLTYALDGAEIF